MKAILADHNIERHVAILIKILESETWQDLWGDVNLPLLTFRDLGLSPDVPDSQLWHTCQREEVVLVTANRNKNDPESLEATIQSHNTADSLPVMTLANAQKVLNNRHYAERAAAQLLDYLLNIDMLLGTGRLYLP